MMTGNTFDEAMQETNNIPMPEDDMGLDIDLDLDPELDDPDAIEKAIYQLRIAEEKEIEPEEVLDTPYGPGLSNEEIDLLLDAYPALDAGIDLDMIDENFDEVDRMLDKSGDNIEAAMDAAEQRAEEEGEIGASPAIMRQLGNNLGNSIDAMLNPINEDERRAAELYSHSHFSEHPSEYVNDALTSITGVFNPAGSATATPQPTVNQWGTRVGEMADLPIMGPSIPPPSAEFRTSAMVAKRTDSEKLKEYNDWKMRKGYFGDYKDLLNIFFAPNKDGTFLTPDEIVEVLEVYFNEKGGYTGKSKAWELQQFLKTNDQEKTDARGYTRITSFAGGAPGYQGGSIEDLKSTVRKYITEQKQVPDVGPSPSVAYHEQYQEGDQETPPPPPIASGLQETPTIADERDQEEMDSSGAFDSPTGTTTGTTTPTTELDGDKLVAENLMKVFYTTAYQYSDSGQSDVRQHLPYIFSDTKTLFFLYKGKEAFANKQRLNVAVDKANLGEYDETGPILQTMETNYRDFLGDYLNDPASLRSGDMFRERKELVDRVLQYATDNRQVELWDPEMKEEYLCVISMFGEQGGDLAETNRGNLLKMDATQGGIGWYSSLVHRAVDTLLQYFVRIGYTAQEAYKEVSKFTGTPMPDSIDESTSINQSAVVKAADNIKAQEIAQAAQEEKNNLEFRGVGEGGDPNINPETGVPWHINPDTMLPWGEIPDVGGDVGGDTSIPDPWTTRQDIDWSMFVDPQEDPLSTFAGDQSWKEPIYNMEEQDYIDTVLEGTAQLYKRPGARVRRLTAREQADDYLEKGLRGQYPGVEPTMDAASPVLSFEEFLARQQPPPLPNTRRSRYNPGAIL